MRDGETVRKRSGQRQRKQRDKKRHRKTETGKGQGEKVDRQTDDLFSRTIAQWYRTCVR